MSNRSFLKSWQGITPMVPLMQQGDEKAAIFYNNLFLFVSIRQPNIIRLRRGIYAFWGDDRNIF